MNIAVELFGDVALSRISGEIDLANSSQFADAILARVPDAAAALVLDLSELAYLDSVGIQSMFEIASTLRIREQRFGVSVPEGSVLRSVLKITNLDEVATICATPGEAIALLSAPPS